VIDYRLLLKNPQLTAALFVLALGLASIASAWGFQLIGGYIPCKLCLEQRLSYYAGLPIALLALIAAYWIGSGWLARLGLLLFALVMAHSLYLGTYQAGAEWGFWEGPTDCGATNAGATTSAADLLSQIKKIKIVSCTEASWRMFGLSFAGWNAAICAALVIAGLWGAAMPAPKNKTAE